MKRVLTAIVLVPVVLVLVFLPAYLQWLFTAATALLSALAAWECLGLAHAKGANPPRTVVLIATLALFAVWGEWQDADRFLPVYGVLCLALLLICTFTSPTERMLPDATSSIFCLFYTGLTMVSLPALREQANGPSLLLYLLFVVWAGDIAAYYVGTAWGRHKLAVHISPQKSWEGAIASVAGSMLVAAGLVVLADLLARRNITVLFYADESIWYWVGLAVLVNVAAQVGDLAESALKRSAGVKDSGSLLPGHGGVLDRIDALLVASPVLWYAQVVHHSF
jgi:phosphatidate cytidylyltransferase